MEKTQSVLVVEDNDFVRMQVASYLKAAGYEVLEAPEGEAAYKLIEQRGAADVAIVDVNMQPVGGFEFIKSIRGLNVDMPVILVTGDQTSDLLERAGTWGVGAVLMKPVQKDRLVKTVEKTIAMSRK